MLCTYVAQPIVFANSGIDDGHDDMMGYSDMMEGGAKMASYGMIGAWNYWNPIYHLVFFVLWAFVFSVIFWLTYKLMIENKNKVKRK